MRPWAGVATSLLLTGTLVGCASSEPDVTTLPEVTLASFDGGSEVYLPDLEGPAVVNLWASWCGPCRDELPVVESFSRRYGDEVQVVGIDFQDPQVDRARALARESGLSYDLLTDPDGSLDGSSPFPTLRGLPFWAFVDAEGTVTHLEFVEMTSVEQLRDLAEEHLGASL